MKIKVRVRNNDGGADNSKIWIDEWERSMERKARKCSNIACYATENLVGGHILRADNLVDIMYIAPLCKGCNRLSPDKVFEVYDVDMMAIEP